MGMKSGRVEFITGVMNSCKSFDLIERIKYADLNRLKYLVLKPSVDVRDGAYVRSRMTGRMYKAISVDESNEMLVELILNSAKEYDIVFIDEVQFFSGEFIQHLIDLTLTDDISLIASGLTRDFKQEVFPASRALRIYATEKITFRKSHCYFCGDPNGERYATVDVRMDALDNIVTAGESISVEGTDNSYHYETVCRRCYNARTGGVI